jgi:hypothetical protein
MANRTDFNEAEHLGYADNKGVKRVSLFNNGTQVNAATEETLQAVLAASGSAYNYIQKEEGATYTYYGFASSTGWKIKRKTIATSVWQYASGTGSYDTAWTNRATQSYGNT